MVLIANEIIGSYQPLKVYKIFFLAFARNKDLPAGFHYGFSLYILVSKDISVFQFFSSFKKYEWFSTFRPKLVKSIRESIKMIFPDVFRESVMCLSGGFLHEWLCTRDPIGFST